MTPKKFNFPIKIFFVLIIFFIQVCFQNVYAIEYGGIGGRPAYPREDNPRTESIFIHTVDPGEILNEGIQVVNNSKEEKTLLVYAADSVRSTDGGFACKQLAQTNDDVGKWIQLPLTKVTLEPSTTQVVDFDINIPNNVGPGEHNGCIVIQEAQKDEEKKQGVNLSFRTAIRVALTVPGEIVKELQSTKLFHIYKSINKMIISYAIENKGNVSIDALVDITVKNLFGKVVQTYGGNYVLLPNDTSQFNFNFMSPFWGGIYKVTASAAYDKDTQKEFGLDGNEEWETTYAGPIYLFAPPTIPALVIYGLGLLAIMFFFIKSIKHTIFKKAVKNKWSTYTVRSGENIRFLADKFDISWKKLAKANKLKPPYQLSPGTKIKAPFSDQIKDEKEEIDSII